MKTLNEIYQEITESQQAEILNQMQAFIELAGSSKIPFELEKAMIGLYGKKFRKIIDEFKLLSKGTPSSDQLIWLAGVHTKQDPRKVVKALKQSLGIN